MTYQELKVWAEAFRKKCSYHSMSKIDQKMVDNLINAEVKRLSDTPQPTAEFIKGPLPPSHEGEELIKNYVRAGRSIVRAEAELVRLRTVHLNSQIAIAKWLKPNDAKEDEKFHIWFGDSLLEIRNETVIVRQKGRSIALIV